MNGLKEVATVAFCDATTIDDVHERVLTDAFGLFVQQSITLSKSCLSKLGKCKIVVKVGSDFSNIDIKAAADLGITVCNIPEACLDEIADTTLSFVLMLYRRLDRYLSKEFISMKKTTAESVANFCTGTRRIKGQVLGILGSGTLTTMVSARAKAFGFKIVQYDPNRQGGEKNCPVADVLGVNIASSTEVSNFH